MKQLLVSIPDNEFNFFKKLLSSLDFVKIEETKEPTKSEILNNILQGMKEVELIKKGKLPKKNIESLLREL